MKEIYKISDIPELKQITFQVKNSGSRLQVRINERCSPKLWIWIKWYFAAFNRIRPLVIMSQSNIYTLYVPPIPSQAHARMFSSTTSSYIYKRPLPIAVTIGVTADCQLHCAHCSAANRSNSLPTLTFEELKKTIQGCLDIGVANITFTGGEPLLRKDLEKCIALIPKNMATTQVFTNALELTESRANSLKEAGLHALQISLDSPIAEEHNSLRGNLSAFCAVKQGVQNALQAGIYVGISTYATREFVQTHKLCKMAELCAQWGVNELTVFDAISTGRLKDQDDHLLDASTRKLLIKDGKAMNRKYKKNMNVVTQSWTNSGKGFARIIGCLAAHMQFHITAQGDFTPCDFTPLSIGNVKKQTIRELWDKLISHPEYMNHSTTCRMQDPAFRRTYIDTIPERKKIPYPIDNIRNTT